MMNYSEPSYTTVEDILSNYENYLKSKHSAKFKSFSNLRNENIESARAEAVVFSILRQLNLNPVPIEERNERCMDFQCDKNGQQFYVEVTNISCDKMEDYTGLPHNENNFKCAFRFPTKELQQHVINKTCQMSSGGDLPRVLAVTTHHRYPLDAGAVKELMANTYVYQPFNNIAAGAQIVTDLKESVFFRFNAEKSSIEPCRRSISAIILINIQADRSKIMGLLHPEPSVYFPVDLMENVPFLKIRNWPLRCINNEIETEFVMSNVQPLPVLHVCQLNQNK